MAKITSVEKRSPAYKAGLREGMDLTKIGGMPVVDVLDLLNSEAEEKIELGVITPQGGTLNIRYKKEAYAPLGFETDDSLLLTPRRCRNKCKFCFVDQLPKGLRPTLYVKDDDYRMSMTDGCYVTLTNLSEEDVQRIIRLKISPLYVSVHAADEQVRCFLTGNPHSADTLTLMRRFAAAGIEMHAQIVMCQGINDGKVLDDTIRTLAAMRPSVLSLAVIPVGLTKWREGLYPLQPISRENALSVISLVEGLANQFRGDVSAFCWCSDELYLRAGLPVPGVEYYEDFPQIENGVGLVAQFFEELEYALEDVALGSAVSGEFVLVTGVSFYPQLCEAVKRIKEKIDCHVEVRSIVNHFFGESITVAGLLTGGDIAAQTDGLCTGKTLIIPANTLRENERVFLDDLTVEQLEQKLQCKVIASEGGEGLVSAILGKE